MFRHNQLSAAIAVVVGLVVTAISVATVSAARPVDDVTVRARVTPDRRAVDVNVINQSATKRTVQCTVALEAGVYSIDTDNLVDYFDDQIQTGPIESGSRFSTQIGSAFLTQFGSLAEGESVLFNKDTLTVLGTRCETINLNYLDWCGDEGLLPEEAATIAAFVNSENFRGICASGKCSCEQVHAGLLSRKICDPDDSGRCESLRIIRLGQDNRISDMSALGFLEFYPEVEKIIVYAQREGALTCPLSDSSRCVIR